MRNPEDVAHGKTSACFKATHCPFHVLSKPWKNAASCHQAKMREDMFSLCATAFLSIRMQGLQFL